MFKWTEIAVYSDALRKLKNKCGGVPTDDETLDDYAELQYKAHMRREELIDQLLSIHENSSISPGASTAARGIDVYGSLIDEISTIMERAQIDTEICDEIGEELKREHRDDKEYIEKEYQKCSPKAKQKASGKKD